MNQGKQLATGGDKTKRRELDFYPTPPEVTVALLDFLDMYPSKIWEPACGDGAMSRVLESHGNHKVISTDIRESGYGTGGVDFLQTRKDGQEIQAIITNPPFAMSEQFIRHALSHDVPVVAMVLKSQYWHAAKRHALFEEFPPRLCAGNDLAARLHGRGARRRTYYGMPLDGMDAGMQGHPLSPPAKAFACRYWFDFATMW